MTPGQKAYVADCILRPNYNDGTKRKGWEFLEVAVQDTWERNPTTRINAPGLIIERDTAARALLAALVAVTEALRIHAPGTALNNHRFDDLGIKAYAAIAAARAAGIEPKE